MVVETPGAPTLEGSIESLTELIAGLVGTAAKLHLFKAGFSPSNNSVQADFAAQEADFVGYAPATLTFGPVGVDVQGNASSYGDRVEFQATDGTMPNSIGGAWISVTTSAGPPPVLGSLRYYQFLTPIPMSVALATMGAVVVYKASDLDGKIIIDN